MNNKFVVYLLGVLVGICLTALITKDRFYSVERNYVDFMERICSKNGGYIKFTSTKVQCLDGTVIKRE